MACEDEGCISIKWEIENFIHILETEVGRSVCSPFWKVEHTNEESTWMRLNAYQSGSYITFHFTNPPIDLLSKSATLSLVTSRGEVRVEYKSVYHFVVKRDVLFGENRQSIRPYDNLTLLCKLKGKTIRNREFRFSSVLHNINYLWEIEKFAAPRPYTKMLIEHDNFLLEVSLTKQCEKGTRTFKVQVAYADRYLNFVDVSLSIVGGQMRVLKIYQLSYAKFMCDFETVSEKKKGINLNIASIVALHKICQDQKLHSSSEMSKQKNVSEAVFGNSGALVDDLLLLYREGAISDATLNTEGKSFSAHRSILAARSPVFRAMFEKDEMSEGRSGVVDIDDVDSETVDRMLHFLYSDLLQDMQWGEASALYYAADKYAVQPLKQKCADILKAGLTVDSACDALILADKHLDEQLMKFAVDFIGDHQEILSSSDWKKIEKTNPYLVIEVFRKVFVKKETI